MRTTFVILKTFGNIPLKNDLLISSDNGPDKVSLASLRTFVGMLLGPKEIYSSAALLLIYRLLLVWWNEKSVSDVVFEVVRKMFFSWEDFFLNIFAIAGKKVIETPSDVLGSECVYIAYLLLLLTLWFNF